MPRHRARDAATSSHAAALSTRSAAQVLGPAGGADRMRAGYEPSCGRERDAPGDRAVRPHPHQRPARPPACALGPARGPPRQRRASRVWPALSILWRAPALKGCCSWAWTLSKPSDMGMGVGGAQAESVIAPPRAAERRRATPRSRAQWCRDSHAKT